jgi:hypothetical protein
MMMGTPGRPGMTMTGPLSARAAQAVPIKMAKANPARIVSCPDFRRVFGKADSGFCEHDTRKP